MPLDRPLRYGMVGGGPGAFIGEVHRRAAAFDGLARLTAGAFSSDPGKSRRQGAALHLDPARVYGSFDEMAEREAALPAEERIDFVAVVTPNHLHVPVCRAFIEHGFHVVCDKPLATTLEDAEALCRLVVERDVVFALTHNYSGYPMVRQARALVREGRLGTVRRVQVAYLQGWLAERVEATGQKQAAWRTDPELAGAGALGDIGTHAEHLARFVTGLELEALCADVTTFVEGRAVDDDAAVLLRFAGGARGVLTCSQIAAGEENGLALRVYGTEGGLIWQQERPTELRLIRNDGPEEVHRPGHDYLREPARRAGRLPAGHPEAFYEAFATLYADALKLIGARVAGEPRSEDVGDLPTVGDGARGLHFVERTLQSAQCGGWVDARYTPPG